MCNWDEDALTMAVAASQDCLSGLDKSKIDAVYMASTSLPFDDRENAGILKGALNLRDQIATADFSSSQKAGTSALVAALESIKGGDRHRILVTASDHRRAKSAWTQEMSFGDGAASLLLGEEDVIADFLGSYSVSYDFVDHYRGKGVNFDYNWEERWVRDEGYTKIYPEAIAGLLDKVGMSVGDISRLVYPCILKRAHADVAKAVGAKPEQVTSNMHEETGECGTAHPFLMLVRELENAQPGDKLLVTGFGQGADALLFQVTEKIKELPQKVAVSRNLARRKEEQSYTKYLKFNELINTEMGIRAESPKQTALSALWRDRKLILGFVGGQCTACGTPQIPKTRICVKPDCGAIDSQEDYEFTERPAKVLTFTGDMLAVSVEPPAIYGMVQFDEGGRTMMDFTDCSLDDVEVGVPVKLAFRKKYFDEQRGFTGYFWKAVPQKTQGE
jgi:3-hydroxy-3-methylglutaryl CoA synthase